MAYEPTDVFIPCPNNGFIVEGYTKSYKFYIDSETYPVEYKVGGIIWIVDIEALSKTDLNAAQNLAGPDYKKDPNGNVYYPFKNNYYSFSNLERFPDKNPKDGSDLLDTSGQIQVVDGVSLIRSDLGSSLRRIEYGELNDNYSVDDFINLSIKYLEESYRDIVYCIKEDRDWIIGLEEYEGKKITNAELLKIYDNISKKPENKITLKIGVKPILAEDWDETVPTELIFKHISHDTDPPTKITFEINQITGNGAAGLSYSLLATIATFSQFQIDPTTKSISIYLAEIEKARKEFFYTKNEFMAFPDLDAWMDKNFSNFPSDKKYTLTEYTPKPEEKKPEDATKPPEKVDPRKVVGKFTLKVKSGPGVIIGINEVDIVDGKADFTGIEFDQPGDYVLTISCTAGEVDTAEINVTVLPPPEAIPQDEKPTEEPAVGTRPIICQIDQPSKDLVSPMDFSTEGTGSDGVALVGGGVGVTPFLNYNGSQINDRDIQTLNLYHDTLIPKISVIFRDTNGLISGEPPRDDTKFEFFLQSKSNDLKSIHMKFKIEEFGKLPNNTYSITGTMDLSKLYRNQFKVKRGTSFEVLREVCKELGLGFNSNIVNTDDNMPWRNIGDKQYKFMEDIIKHSYISDTSYMAGYIDYYYCFNYVDIEKEMKRDITKDVCIETGGLGPSDEKDQQKITKLALSSEKGMQSSVNFFVKVAERNEAAKIGVEQGYKTRTKYYDKVKKMFLVFDVDSTTSDESKTMILKGAENDKEAFDNNYTTKYQGKIDTDNVHKNHNYAVTQNKINLDNMMKNQMDIVLPNPNFNLYRFQKVMVSVSNPIPNMSNPELILWRNSGEWLIAKLGFSFNNGSLSQNITLVRKEMGKNPEEIREGKKNATQEKKEEKHENPIVESLSTIKPNDKYKVGDVFTVQDPDKKRYILTITKVSENGTDVVATLRDPNVVADKTLTSPDTISGVSKSTTPVEPPKVEEKPITASASAYPYQTTLEKMGGNTLYDAEFGKDGKLKGDVNQYLVDTEDYSQSSIVRMSGAYPIIKNSQLVSIEDNIKESARPSIFLAINRPVPVFKPEKGDKQTPKTWVLFELSDYGINQADSAPKEYNTKLDLWRRVLNRLFYEGESKSIWEDEGYTGEWKVPKGYIKIIDESGKVIDDTSKGNSRWNIGGSGAGKRLTWEYGNAQDPNSAGWYDAGQKVPDDEAYPELSSNIIWLDLSHGSLNVDENGNTILHEEDGHQMAELQKNKPGVYTIEVKYYVPLYEKINSDGDNKGKPYNGTGPWEIKKERLLTKDANGYNPHEARVLKGTFTIAKKSKKMK
jgi:hypothetical protein